MVSDLSPIGLPFLDALAASPRPADRQLWLRVAADCLIALPAGAPRRQAVLAAAIAALGEADEATRSAFARRLAPYPVAADALAAVEALGGEAALVALAEAVALPRERLAAAADGEAAQARAVARRADLDADAGRRGWSSAKRSRSRWRWRAIAARRSTLRVSPRWRAAPRRASKRRATAASPTRCSSARRRRSNRRPCSSRPTRRTAAASSPPRSARPSAGEIPLLTAARPRASPRGSNRTRWRATGRVSRRSWPRRSAARRRSPRASPATPPASRSRSRWRRSTRRTTRRCASSPRATLLDGGEYRRIAALARLKDALSPAAARLTMAAMIGAPQPTPTRQRPQYDPTAAATPSRPAAAIRNAVADAGRSAPPPRLGAGRRRARRRRARVNEAARASSICPYAARLFAGRN